MSENRSRQTVGRKCYSARFVFLWQANEGTLGRPVVSSQRTWRRQGASIFTRWLNVLWSLSAVSHGVLTCAP
jgi:hypothetical protein